MAEYARVESLDALRKFRVALCRFAELASSALDEAEADIQRTGFWLDQDRASYWKQQTTLRTELFHRAKRALAQKKAEKTATGAQRSYVDELKALAVAERKLAEAQQKSANVRRWTRKLDEERFSYQAVAQGLSLTIQSDLPTALTHLDNMIAAIEAYAVSGTPSETRSVADGWPGDLAGTADELESMARDLPEPPPDAEPAEEAPEPNAPDEAVDTNKPPEPE